MVVTGNVNDSNSGIVSTLETLKKEVMLTQVDELAD